MDTKIAAALNSLNLNSQQKKVINEVLDNKFKYIDANNLNIKTKNPYGGDSILNILKDDEYFGYYDIYLETTNSDDGCYYKYYIDDGYICCQLTNNTYNLTLDIDYTKFKVKCNDEAYCTEIDISSGNATFDFSNETEDIKYNSNLTINNDSINISFIKFYNNKLIFDSVFCINDEGLNYECNELINNRYYTKYECVLKENELTFTSFFDNDYFSQYPYGTSIKNDIYTNRTANTCTIISNDIAMIYMGKMFTSGNLDDLLANLISIFIHLETRVIQIAANYVECEDFKVLDENNNVISVKDSIQDIYNKINNNDNDNGNDITQSFVDREIEELIYKTAEIRSKANEYDTTGDYYRELVISEKEYNKYNYTWEDNSVHNYLHEQYNKIVVYKDILTKTINITNSNGEQEEINVLIVE